MYFLFVRQILKIGENAVVEVAEAWGGMTGLLDLEAPVRTSCRVRMAFETVTGCHPQD